MYWSSTHPDSTLKNIGECVSKSTLRKLHLEMNMPASGEAPVTEERPKEWLQCVEVGGKELIQSLVDSHLEDLYLFLYYKTHSYSRSRSYIRISTRSTRSVSKSTQDNSSSQHNKKSERTTRNSPALLTRGSTVTFNNCINRFSLPQQKCTIIF